jgi:hypothetical protein
VLTSVTVGPAGGTLPPVTSNGATFTLTVPPGAFPADVQITLTSGDLAAIGAAAASGFTVVATLGVQVQLDGAAYPGTFGKPLTITSHDSRYTASSVVAIWNGSSLTPYANATSAPGVVTISFDTDPAIAIESPEGEEEGTVPKATPPTTGKPIVGEGILAGALLVAGAGGLAMRRRQARP